MNLIEHYQQNLEEFIASFIDMPANHFNQKPEEGSWSVGQVVEHIFRSELASTRILNGKTKTPDEHSDEKAEYIRRQFTDRKKKFTAFGPIVPSEDPKDPQELAEKIRQNRKKQIQLLETADLNEICLNFEHPLFGLMSRKEWMVFNSTHANRHKAQISDIRSQLNI